MRVLVNALSATAPSGQHVLFGHVQQLARWTVTDHEFHIIATPHYKPRDIDLGTNVYWHDSPPTTRGWIGRTYWETTSLPGWAIAHGMELYFTPTGTILPRFPIPQISLAQNPWCMTSAVFKSISEHSKALIQRRAYRAAQSSADLMIYNSNHMRRLYLQNAGGRDARQAVVAYQGIHDATHALAEQTRTLDGKEPCTILCVSVMARWKNCEALIRAVKKLRDRQVPARLRLVGGWPDLRYRREIECEIQRLNLMPHVTIEGHVSSDELYSAYRTARVFALLSKCESFGIPAIEAQAFGTPVMGSNTCAMPETGGDGGVYIDPDDVETATETLYGLLTDDAYWATLSLRAIENSQIYRWEQCTTPLMKMFSLPANRRATRIHAPSSQSMT